MKERFVLAFACVLLLLAGCGKKELSEVTQEDLDAVEAEGRIVGLLIHDQHYYDGDSVVHGEAFYDTGQVTLFDFGSWTRMEDYPPQVIYDYLINTNEEERDAAQKITDIEPEKLAEYIVRLGRIDAENTKSYTEEADQCDDAATEWEYYGVRYEPEPVFIFLYQETEVNGKRVYPDDIEARRAYELIEEAYSRIDWRD